MRRFLRTTAAVASSAGLLASHLPSPRCETADDAYLRALRGEAAAAPATPPAGAAPPALLAPLPAPRFSLPAIDTLSVNLAAHGVPVPTSRSDALYAWAAVRARGGGGGAPLAPLTALPPGGALGGEVAVVGVARGCTPAAAEALQSSLRAAAAAGAGGGGLAWYLVTDATPAAVAAALEARLHVELPEAGERGALPFVVLIDRAGTSKERRKWLMPVAPAAAAEAGDAEGGGAAGGAGGAAGEDGLALAAVPYPSAVVAFLDRALAGSVAPTLLGEVRAPAPLLPLPSLPPPPPPNHGHPYVTPVTSATWEAVVLGNGSRDVVLEAYLSNCPMCMCLAPRVAMAGEVAARFFPPSAPVAVAAVNVDFNDRPRDWMPGEAFPTLQMFNNRAGPGAAFSTAGGAACAHPGARAAPPPAPAPRPGGVARSTAKGTPPCVPSLDFSHPTAPGKMALPTVGELVEWMAARCSSPFSTEPLRVHAGAVRGGAVRAPWAALAGGGAPAPAPAPPDAAYTVPLCALLDDMDAEARVLEAAVFEALYAGHVLELVRGAAGAPPVTAPSAVAAALRGAAAGHASAQAVHAAAGGDIRAYRPAQGPTPALGGLPGVANDAQWTQDRLPRLAAAEAALREAATGPAARYGGADAAWAAMEAAKDAAEACGARDLARKWMFDQEDLRAIAAALPLAAALAKPPPGSAPLAMRHDGGGGDA
jgi:hypothetical protein